MSQAKTSSEEAQPTETSPLLPKHTTKQQASGQILENSEEAAAAVSQIHPHVRVDEEAPGSNEASSIPTDRERQYEGIPELRKKMVYVFPALAIGVFMAAADQTIIVSSAVKIGGDLGALSERSWIATAYFLTLTSFQPLYGKLSDIYGRKSCLLFAYAVFGLGCLFCGLAQDMKQLIAARAFAGIGGGGMTTVVSILLSDVIPLQERGVWQGYINIIFASGAGVGAPMGGLLADTVGWRLAFIIQSPLCLLAFTAVYFVLREPSHASKSPGQSAGSKLKRIDFLGAATLVAAVFALLFGLDQGSNHSWSSLLAIIPLALSVPLVLAFIFVEVRIAEEPFAPGHIVFNRSLIASYLCNFFSFAGYMGVYFYVPLYFQAVDGYSAARGGLLLVPNVIAGVSGSLSAGFYIKRFGTYFWITVFGYALMVFGIAIIISCSGVVINSDFGIAFGGVFTGFGNGIGVTSTLIALIANSKRDEQAIATACSYLFRSLGSTMGVQLSSSVANQTLKVLLQRDLSGENAGKIAKGVRDSLDFLNSLQPSVLKVVRYDYMVSVQAAYLLEASLLIACALSAWLIKEQPLSAS